MEDNLWLRRVTCLVYCLDNGLSEAIKYLKEQVESLKEQQEKDTAFAADLLLYAGRE